MKTKLLIAAALLALCVPAYAQEEIAPAPTEAATDQAPAVVEGTESVTPIVTEQTESNPVAEGAISVEDPAAEEHVAPAAEDTGTHHAPEVPQMDWSFEGPFGTFDRASLQRGFQVYKQVCAACHSLNRMSYRNLAALGYNEAEIKSIAAEATIMDGPNDEGEMYERPGRPSDTFKAPFANDNAARYANNGALPPDLSLIVRARADGSNYVHGLLTGYEEAPAGTTIPEGMYYNKYFAGHQIAMAPPLTEGVITFDDGTNGTIDQMASDVATFLTWASEPAMEIRKQMGIKVLIFLAVFTGLMYLTKRKIWKDLH